MKPSNPARHQPALRPGRIILEPMDGELDHTLRRLISRYGGIDRCVTEFLRVTDQLLPRRELYRFCPELHQGGHTDSGVPVWIQLQLGRASRRRIGSIA